MKSFFIALALLSNASAFASGGVSCDLSVGTLSTLDLSFATGNVMGSPIISDVTLVGSGAKFRHINTTIRRSLVVNYMNTGSQLYIHSLDDNAERSVVILGYNFDTKKGSAITNVDGKKTIKLKKIKCEQE